MNLDVLKSHVHISKWRDSKGSITLSFDVVPTDNGYLEIGDEYIFAPSSWARIHGQKRTLIGASVSITSDQDVLANIQPLFSDEKHPFCGWGGFYKERESTLDYLPPSLIFTIVVEPNQFEELLRSHPAVPDAAKLDLTIEGLKYGWEPDGSHMIWNPDDIGDKRPISSFSYTLRRSWTSEGAIRNEADRMLNAELADSPNPEDRKLAALSIADSKPEPIVVVMKQCRALLVALLIACVLVFVRLSA